MVDADRSGTMHGQTKIVGGGEADLWPAISWWGGSRPECLRPTDRAMLRRTVGPQKSEAVGESEWLPSLVGRMKSRVC
jgi:hypothetical protein